LYLNKSLSLLLFIFVVTIKTTSEKEFKGFLLQAHNGKGVAVGSFTIPDDTEGKTLDCGEGSAVMIYYSFVTN